MTPGGGSEDSGSVEEFINLLKPNDTYIYIYVVPQR